MLAAMPVWDTSTTETINGSNQKIPRTQGIQMQNSIIQVTCWFLLQMHKLKTVGICNCIVAYFSSNFIDHGIAIGVTNTAKKLWNTKDLVTV